MKKGEPRFLAFIKDGKVQEVHRIVGTRLAPRYVAKTGVTVLPVFTFGKGAYGVKPKSKRAKRP